MFYFVTNYFYIIVPEIAAVRIYDATDRTSMHYLRTADPCVMSSDLDYSNTLTKLSRLKYQDTYWTFDNHTSAISPLRLPVRFIIISM